MISLFDVNALIALALPPHIFADALHGWLSENEDVHWATCPITENGLVRIVSQPTFPYFDPARDVVAELARLKRHHHHQFWPDDLSITDPAVFAHEHIQGHRQLTDAYLLGLAVRNGGRLVTFDRKLSITCVRAAKPKNLVVLPPNL